MYYYCNSHTVAHCYTPYLSFYDYVQLDTSGEEQWRPSSANSSGSGNTAQGSNNSGGKFRKLQLKWEMMSNAESPVTPPSKLFYQIKFGYTNFKQPRKKLIDRNESISSYCILIITKCLLWLKYWNVSIWNLKVMITITDYLKH